MCEIPSIKPCFVKLQTLTSMDNPNKITTDFINANQILGINKEETPGEAERWIAYMRNGDNEIQEIELDPKIAKTFDYIA